MNIRSVIFYQFKSFYKIMKEIEAEVKFNILEALDDDDLKEKLNKLDNYILISEKKQNFSNQLVINNLPINIFKFIEKLNVLFLKNTFKNQSYIKINNYIIDHNSRQICLGEKKLKLTEKEIDIIVYLIKSSKPISTKELQNKVWDYQSNLETHTVETHIYRLRKKILDIFNDNHFILSKKNGYIVKC